MSVPVYRISAKDRDLVVTLIARRLGISVRSILRTTRTDAQLVAVARDGHYCQYHYYILDSLRPAHDAHHLDGRTPSGDVPWRILTLCRECHWALHNAQPEAPSRTGIERALCESQKRAPTEIRMLLDNS